MQTKPPARTQNPGQYWKERASKQLYTHLIQEQEQARETVRQLSSSFTPPPSPTPSPPNTTASHTGPLRRPLRSAHRRLPDVERRDAAAERRYLQEAEVQRARADRAGPQRRHRRGGPGGGAPHADQRGRQAAGRRPPCPHRLLALDHAPRRPDRTPAQRRRRQQLRWAGASGAGADPCGGRGGAGGTRRDGVAGLRPGHEEPPRADVHGLRDAARPRACGARDVAGSEARHLEP